MLIPYRVEKDGDTARVYVYDCNKISSDDNEVWLTFTYKNDEPVEWSYVWDSEKTLSGKIGDMFLFSELTYLGHLEDHARDILGIEVPEQPHGIARNCSWLLTLFPGTKDIVTYMDAVIQCRNGVVTESAQTNLIQIRDFSAESETEEEEPYLFYVPEDEPAFTITGQDDAPAGATLVSDDAELSINAGAHAVIRLDPNQGDFKAEITPAGKDETVTITYATAEMELAVTGTADREVTVRTDESESFAEICGLRSAAVTITAQEEVATTDVEEGTLMISPAGVQVEPLGLPGDINGDTSVDAKDLTALARHVARIESITDETLLKNADVTGDNDVTASDLTKLARYVARIISEL